MRYATATALRMALEQRLLTRSNETGVSLDRLRRRVLFERIVARLQAAEPGRWVLKGGMALEIRLHDDARVTKDLDLGLRDVVTSATDLHERLIDALTTDPDQDRFVLTSSPPKRLREDGGSHPTWRAKVAAELAGKAFGGLQIDVSPRAHELDTTDRMALPSSLDFAGISAPVIEVVDVHRHAAEKFHAMLRSFGDRENSRVRDLVDIVILREHDLIDAGAAAVATRQVWGEREGGEPPGTVGHLPPSWPSRYEHLAAEHGLAAKSFPAAVDLVDQLWTEMFPTEEA